MSKVNIRNGQFYPVLDKLGWRIRNWAPRYVMYWYGLKQCNARLGIPLFSIWPRKHFGPAGNTGQTVDSVGYFIVYCCSSLPFRVCHYHLLHTLLIFSSQFFREALGLRFSATRKNSCSLLEIIQLWCYDEHIRFAGENFWHFFTFFLFLLDHFLLL